VKSCHNILANLGVVTIKVSELSDVQYESTFNDLLL
jgi:hypothetical protein